jgi:mRNA interferase MazF
MVIERGEIWWAELPNPRGSEPGYRRPVLIIQSDRFNRSRIRTVLICVLTSSTRLADAPGNVLLSPRVAGLPKPSVVNVSQLMTLDKAFLVRRIRRLAPREQRADFRADEFGEPVHA